MSLQQSMRKHIRSIRRTGEIRRPQWNAAERPYLKGWPMRQYLKWERESGYTGTPNLCLFFWAVVLFRPLQVVGNLFRKILPGANVGNVLAVIAVVMVVVLMIYGFMTDPRATFTIIGLVVAYLCVSFVLITYGKAFFTWFFAAQSDRVPWLGWVRPWMVAVAVVFALSPFWTPFRVASIIIAGLLVVIAAVVGMAWAITTVADRHRAQEDARKKEAYLRVVFAAYHPEWVGDEDQYQQWLIRYGAWREAHRIWGWNETVHPFSEWTYEEVSDIHGFILDMPYQAWLIHMEARRPTVVREEVVIRRPNRGPSRIAKVWGVIAAFLEMFWAFLVAKKGRTCPIIVIPEDVRRDAA